MHRAVRKLQCNMANKLIQQILKQEDVDICDVRIRRCSATQSAIMLLLFFRRLAFVSVNTRS